MSDILFTHSYFLRFDPKEYRAMMPYQPLGTLYAAAVAREAGYSVALFDSMLMESPEQIAEHLVRHTPRFLVIYDDDFNYLTKMCLTRMREAAFRMARLGKKHGCTVIVHSSDATDHQEKYFEHGADYIMFGEAEQTLRELLEHLHGNGAAHAGEIPGVAVRDADGSVRRGPRRAVLRELDSLPMPARDLVDVAAYRSEWRRRHGYFSINVATTRGCPYRCNWCAKPIYGRVYNSRSPRCVAEEFKSLKEQYNPDHIWICDDIFGLKPGWVEEFSRHVAELDAVIPFKCLSRADLILRGDTAAALSRAGCATVWIGAESGAQKVLDAMEKGTTVGQIHRATAKLRAYAIRVGFFLQFGYPGEGDREIDATLEMVRRALPEEIGISVSYPLPGTKFYERVIGEMGEKRNWSESADLAMMFHGTYSTEFYRALARYVHQEHRRQQGLRAMRSFFTNLPVPPNASRRVLLLPYHTVRAAFHSFMVRRLRRPVAPVRIMLPVVQPAGET
ncbi:MAG: B12-binding domain-containing radical SAM protein [Bacteroidetes bacterium]|nr:B12-binding domain-containing radical SAM protein [Bacteroidota bacterium]